MITSVIRPLRASGRRNAPTEFEMASRPVSDEPPLATPRRITVIAAKAISPLCEPNGSMPAWREIWAGTSPIASRTKPTTTTAPSPRMNR